MSERRDQAQLHDIVHAAELIARFVDETDADDFDEVRSTASISRTGRGDKIRIFPTCLSQDDLHHLLDIGGRVEIARDVVVTLDKRAHNRILAETGLIDRPTRMPWLFGKRLIL